VSDPAENKVTDATRSTEAEDEQVHTGTDRMPTPEEEAAAERAPDLDPEVAENYRKAAERGANIEGEGKIG
jgi:hypothetical protein